MDWAPSHKNCNLDYYRFCRAWFIGGAAVRYPRKFSGTAAFAVAAFVLQAVLPAASQPAESSEVWCRAYNSDPAAVSRCIAAEQRLLSPSAKPKRAEKPAPVSGGESRRPSTQEKSLAASLPLPRARPDGAPQPAATVTAEPVLQPFDQGLEE